MKLRICLAVAAAMLLMPATASAGHPVAGCSAGTNLLSVEATVARIDDRIYSDPSEYVPLVESIDENEDGWLCSKQFKPNKGQDKQWGAVGYVITQVSDNKVGGRTP